ncbi:MAG TPA: hypothetical protein VGK54_03905 [Chloroflexota bacterium]|jgi:hypothetical protein
MATDRIWRALVRLGNVVGVAVALGALGLVGYFVSLLIPALRHV